MQIINKHSLTVLEVTSRERGEEFKGAEWVELQSYVSALRAERDELREALEEIANGRYGKSVAVKNIARAVLAKYQAAK